MSYSIYLGPESRLKLLYSFPNSPNGSWSLATTILHWFNLTLSRDGLAAKGARAAVRVEGPDVSPNYFLDLDGPPDAAMQFPEYGARLPQFLNHGWDALKIVIPQLKDSCKWDPDPDPEPPPYRPWRFFLPFGMAMLNQRSLQFFHYPPIRLLEEFQDYLYDPVPFRWNELLQANGVTNPAEWPLYSTVMDATPIAAADDQGSKKSRKGDPTFGLIPIQYFPDYQRAQVQLLLNTASSNEYFTIPIVVFGSHPNQIFSKLYNVPPMIATTASIIPGKKTAVLGTHHPYAFYAEAQGFETVGSGKIIPAKCKEATSMMAQDLAAARWQKMMADDPSRDPQQTLLEAQDYWKSPARAAEICALVQHEGSLLYPDPTKSLDFKFQLSMADAAAFCSAHNNDPCAAS